MIETKRFSLVKPTTQTPFHIDFDWWREHDSNWKVYLFSYLCAEHQAAFQNTDQDAKIDWVDPVTAEVFVVDGLEHTLMSHCALQPDFLTQNTSLVDAVFRSFLKNGNKPLTPQELSEITGKTAVTILNTFSGPTIYKGIRPVQK
jgi:hypothetical protein